MLAALIFFACSSPKTTTEKASPTPSTVSTASPSADDLVLADGRIRIPRKNIGDVDLTKLPLGNGKVGSSAKRGQMFLCNTRQGEQSRNEAALPWISGSTFDLTKKTWVAGNVSWPAAEFTATVSGDKRVVEGNSLPLNHTTGVFPAASNDPARAYRPTPSSIKENDYRFELPANPTSGSPNCMGMEVGVAIDGVPLFNAVDAQFRDALAEEVEDHCSGHPNDIAYHYHSIPECLSDPGEGHSALMAYAFDGFGIFGHRGESGKVMTNADLDECHGHSHEIDWDGKKVTMFHYHATWEYPFTVGCYRGKSAVQGPAFGNPGGGGGPPGGPPP